MLNGKCQNFLFNSLAFLSVQVCTYESSRDVHYLVGAINAPAAVITYAAEDAEEQKLIKMQLMGLPLQLVSLF